MTSNPQENAGDDGFTPGAGSDQDITGEPETGTFQTDKAPTADTPAHGSSNAGLNGPESAEDAPGTRTTYE